MKIDIVIKAKIVIGRFLICGVLLSIFGCRMPATTKDQLNTISVSSQACLEELNLAFLEKALKDCNEVITQYPNNPEPLNDRSLIYTLMGDMNSACNDVNQALKLLDTKVSEADPLVRHELIVRKDSCIKRVNMLGID